MLFRIVIWLLFAACLVLTILSVTSVLPIGGWVVATGLVAIITLFIGVTEFRQSRDSDATPHEGTLGIGRTISTTQPGQKVGDGRQ